MPSGLPDEAQILSIQKNLPTHNVSQYKVP